MHVAIIMDGNGRWAAQRGLPRSAGHIEGAKAVRRVVESAARAGLSTLTLYAFSADNWGRPPAEVSALLRLFHRYLLTETRRCVEQQIRLSVIGRRDRLGANLLQAIEHSERLTAHGARLHLRIAVDYSARFSIVATARVVRAQWTDAIPHAAAAGCAADATHDFLRLMDEVNHSGECGRDVDLLIRTGGEKRLSDFMLWECAYAELYFTDCAWPDFDESALQQALRDFAGRQRRFGKLAAESSRA